MSNETENENRRRIDKLESRQETNEKVQEANMEVLRADHRTSQEEVLKQIAEQGKDMSRTIMIAAFGAGGMVSVVVAIVGLLLGTLGGNG